MKGRIRDEDVAEVRRLSGLVEVASEYMQVKRAGRQFRALCPFHSEKTPSFYIDPAKQLYMCHGCQEGGDVFTLVEKLENLSFVEAVERLARRAGVQLEYEQLSASDRKAFQKRARLIDAHRAAVEWYHEMLLRDESAADARAYLKSRGFGRETAVSFTIGFSKPGLAKHLSKQGFSEAELIEAGLASRGPDGSVFDRFRGRVMFPIFGVTGEPVAFGARRLRDGDQGPKYLNSAESPIYKKNQVLYALNWAKGPIVKGGRALIVEGYTDVIALHEAGITEAVAACGTAFGLDHLRTLQRFTQQVVLSPDSDEAGGISADRAYDQMMAEAQRMGVSLKVVSMPPGDDPADSVQKLGSDGFRALVDDAVPLLEFVLRREALRYQVGDPEVRARALAACIRLLAKTEHEVVRVEYARRLSDWIRVDPNVIFVELSKTDGGAVPARVAEAVLKRSSGLVRLEREALRIAIAFPELAKDRGAEIGPECFSVPSHRAIWEALSTGSDVDLIDPEARKTYTQLAVQVPEGEVTDRRIAEIFSRLKGTVLSRQIDELKSQLQRLNPMDDRQTYDTLFARLIELERERRALLSEDEEER